MKILITLLGTGRSANGDEIKNRYETTDYLLDGKLYQNETFTSNAIIKHFAIQRVFYIGTNFSMWDNVADFFGDDEFGLQLLDKKESRALKENDLEKLSELINKKLDSCGSQCFIVEDGESEDELWNMFEKFLGILDSINNCDEVYLDITHLFRSVSVMSFIMAEFGKTYKDFKIGGVFYGMLKKNEPSKIINVSVFLSCLNGLRQLRKLRNLLHWIG